MNTHTSVDLAEGTDKCLFSIAENGRTILTPSKTGLRILAVCETKADAMFIASLLGKHQQSNQMNTPHTPGPWQVCDDLGHLDIRQDPFAALNDSKTRKTLNIASVQSEDGEANARLIASAPELLAALRMLLDLAERKIDGPAQYGQVCKARAALASSKD